jgi:hypothetical protein
MFQKIIEKFISKVRKFHIALERAYQETYSDKELACEFNRELKKRRKENKEKVVTEFAKFIVKKALDDTGVLMSKNEAFKTAERFYQIAENNGKIDSLNNYID